MKQGLILVSIFIISTMRRLVGSLSAFQWRLGAREISQYQYITWSSACQFPNTSSREFILVTPSLLRCVSTPSFELSQADGKLPLRQRGRSPAPNQTYEPPQEQ